VKTFRGRKDVPMEQVKEEKINLQMVLFYRDDSYTMLFVWIIKIGLIFIDLVHSEMHCL